MTVIAWDNKVLAADGRSTCGTELISDKNVKLREVNHPEYGKMVAGFCGVLLVVEPWIKHIEANGFTPFPTPDEDCHTVGVFVGKEKVIEANTDGLWTTISHPAAFGSGSTIAQHFLNRGDDAITAVREASAADITCGGQIIAYDPKTDKFKVYAK